MCEYICALHAQTGSCSPKSWRRVEARSVFRPSLPRTVSFLVSAEVLTNAVGSEHVAQTKVQAFASRAWDSLAARQWFPRFPSRPLNADEQFRSIAEIASTETRPR